MSDTKFNYNKFLFKKSPTLKEKFGEQDYDKILNLLCITPEQDDLSKIKIIDEFYFEDKNETLYNLQHSEDLELHAPFVKGLVLLKHEDEYRVITSFLPFVEEKTLCLENGSTDFVFNDIKFVSPTFSGDSSQDDYSKIKFTECKEGTMVRLHYYNNWLFSTSKKIDARKSKWAGPAFYDVFKKFSDSIDPSGEFNFLDKTYTYFFQIFIPENKICASYTEPKLFLFGVYKFESGKLIYINSSIDGLNSETPISSYVFDSVDNKTFSFNSDNIGFVFQKFNSDNSLDGHPLKINSMDFYKKKLIRGDQKSISFRYIQIKLNEVEGVTVSDIVNHYSEYNDVFKKIDLKFNLLAKKLKQFYHKRYIEGKYLRLEPCFHGFLKNVKENYNPTFTCYHNIYFFLYKCKSYQINKMFKIIEQQKKLAQ